MNTESGNNFLEEDNKDELNSDDFNDMVDKKIVELKENESIAFVDGSYDTENEKSGFGAIIISYGKTKDTLYKAFTKNLDKAFISLRNVAAELEGVKEAINWAIQYKKEKISIFYDYNGIELWADGSWKANNRITKEYVAFIKEKRNQINIEFIKVKAHSGISFNEEADALAKYSLLAKGYKTYNDGSVYFVGFGVEDWKIIVDCINDENKDLEIENIAKIEMFIEEQSKKDRITIVQLNNKVFINCYSNYRSYVQGKSSVLFQKLIATAIELLPTGEKVVETLNNFHALTIKEEEVENKFDELLPNYIGNRNSKHYYNLLSATYNTMLTGYMPDYTCLVTPIFRAYEFYLHKILGEKMGLETATDKGMNKFSFFSKDSSGLYYCTSRNARLLTINQKDYLNKLYTKYNGLRHPYSHWSADDLDTAVITDITTAREYLTEGLNLINEYYLCF